MFSDDTTWEQVWPTVIGGAVVGGFVLNYSYVRGQQYLMGLFETNEETKGLTAMPHSDKIKLHFDVDYFKENKHVKRWNFRVTDLKNHNVVTINMETVYHDWLLNVDERKRYFLFEENIQPDRLYRVEMLPVAYCCRNPGPTHYTIASTDELKREEWQDHSNEDLIARLRETLLNLRRLNIQLFGAIGVGKSSLLNLCETALTAPPREGEVEISGTIAHVGPRASSNRLIRSITNENMSHRLFELQHDPDGVKDGERGAGQPGMENSVLFMNDPWGIENLYSEYDQSGSLHGWPIAILRRLLNGELDHDIKRDDVDRLLQEEKQQERPRDEEERFEDELYKKVHVVWIVINGNEFFKDPERYSAPLRPYIKVFLHGNEVTPRIMVIATHADEFLPTTEHAQMHQRGRTLQLKRKIIEHLQVSEQDIFLVQNYRGSTRNLEQEKLVLQALCKAVAHGKHNIKYNIQKNRHLTQTR